MRKLLLCLLVFITAIGFSQDSSRAVKSNWRAGPSGSVLRYDNISAHPGFDHTYSYKKIGLRSGIDIGYLISRRSLATIGFHYFLLSYKVDYVWVFQQPGDPHIPRQSNINASYLDIPLNFNFSFISRKGFELYTTSGIMQSILLRDTGTTVYEDNSRRKSEFINPSFLSWQAGIGFRYKANQRSRINLELQYRQFLKGFDSIMDQSPNAICVILSCDFNIDWKCFFKKGAWKPLPVCD